MARGSAKTGKYPASKRVVWRMYREDPPVHDPRVSWSAVGPKACARMGTMLMVSIGTRATIMRSLGAEEWGETGLPQIVLVIDEGIDIGPWADTIFKQGSASGVEFHVVPKGE